MWGFGNDHPDSSGLTHFDGMIAAPSNCTQAS